MPPKLSIQSTQNELVDTWGRKNRSLEDKICPVCGTKFRPYRAQSKYCSRPCMWSQNGKHQKPLFNDRVNSRGYVFFIAYENGVKKEIKKHRHIMEQHIGRKLLDNEDVHHIDGNRFNNDISNLQLMTHAEHTNYHNQFKTHKRGYKMNLSDEEREARRQRMYKCKEIVKARAIIRAAEGEE